MTKSQPPHRDRFGTAISATGHRRTSRQVGGLSGLPPESRHREEGKGSGEYVNERQMCLGRGINTNSLFSKLLSLFCLSEIPCSDAQGISSRVPEFPAHYWGASALRGRLSANFPVFFPVTGNLARRPVRYGLGRQPSILDFGEYRFSAEKRP